MRRSILIFILGVGATLLTLYLVERVRSNAVRVPPWHPFEVRSDLRLDDLVADGYRFSDMPCGMLHFAKTLGDTTIRYYVDIDCEDYSGKYEPPVFSEMELVDEEVIPPSEADTSYVDTTTVAETDQWERERSEDPYWPLSTRDLRGCYQRVSWRNYWFTMETIDSLAIRQFVENHGGYLFAEHWDRSAGGEFLVRNNSNELTFHCRIERHRDANGNFLPWQFVMNTHIPFLDQARYEEHLERERRRAAFYDHGEVSWPVFDTVE